MYIAQMTPPRAINVKEMARAVKPVTMTATILTTLAIVESHQSRRCANESSAFVSIFSYGAALLLCASTRGE